MFSTPSGKWINDDRIILSDSEKKDIIRNFVDYKFVTRSKHCQVIEKNLFYISPYRDVQPCCFIPIRLGNILKEDLKGIWHRMIKSQIYKTDSAKCIMEDKNFRMKIIKYLNGNNKDIVNYSELEDGPTKKFEL